MKFGKVLQSTAEHFPEKQFLGYKKLKKFLKTLTAAGPEGTNTNTIEADVSEEARAGGVDDGQFIQLLNQELRELNAHFIGEEEGMVIRFQALKSAVQCAKPEEKLKYAVHLATLHGDLVSLMHWGSLNYVAIAKILKKHDKLLVDHPIRQCYLESVLHQPFYSTELVERLAKESEDMIGELNPEAAVPVSVEAQEQEKNSITETMPDEDFACSKKMLYAIRTWKDLGDNAHTPSTVLPYSKPLPETMKMLKHLTEEKMDTSKETSLSSEEQISASTKNSSKKRNLPSEGETSASTNSSKKRSLQSDEESSGQQGPK